MNISIEFLRLPMQFHKIGYFCRKESDQMKKIILISAALLVMTACKKVEDVKVDEVKTETQGDTLTGKDTVAVHDVTPASEIAEAKITETPAKAPNVEPAQVLQTTGKPAVPGKTDLTGYTLFGSKFIVKNVLTPDAMLAKYKSLKQGDTAVVQFKSKVKEVCKKKGCWMSLLLPNGKESFMRFKDYGFFVPKNADGSDAIAHGKAYLDVVSVAQLQHYAKDGGKSQAEIDQIKEPKITYAFEADGVFIK
ncbi:MAG: DUF4920 domain-containing protein [Flavobacterium sp.]|nr:MAG: DUF4920 domain-containing protein [Flavobacterium sp.]